MPRVIYGPSPDAALMQSAASLSSAKIIALTPSHTWSTAIMKHETGDSTSESRHEDIPFPSLDLSVALSLAATTRDAPARD
ncbi:hypothetical protein CLCR_09361 [Cladophialophora carrionii]|uniref:Uncharacterized protein n=1 Tax=Cladophialophora carrionii TaxID=86049 RepID=A0A1C1CUD8_9EURO|nr:hypothetical protein CLCR_09361 [Cladophialophora carrionii]